MRITKEPISRFLYAFKFDLSFDKLDFCRFLCSKMGPGSFNYAYDAWRFNNLDYVQIIVDRFPDTIVEASMQEDMEKYLLAKEMEHLTLAKAQKLKEATETNFVVNNIKGELRPYQKIGVEFFINNNGRAILADQMGAGKTAQALAYVAHMNLSKTLVVAPASVKWAWYSETKKWTKLNPYVVDSKNHLTPDVLFNHDVFIINYDILKKFAQILTTARFDAVVLDEVHYIKNSGSQRTKIAKVIAFKTPNVLLLSGTPLLNRPVELFNSLQIMDTSTWNDWRAFTIRYCNGHQGRFGWDARGASNIEELQSRIARYFLRRTKDQVLKELPPKQFVDMVIDMNSEHHKSYKLAEDNFVKYLREIKNKKEKEIEKSITAIQVTKLNELRQIVSRAKIDAAKETIENIIESGEKVVVFSVYNEPLMELKKHFGKQAVVLTGSTNEQDRRMAISKFQNEPETKIFLGGIKSSGVGITLTAGTNVVFVDFSFVPADHMQAVDRIHRLGQTADHVTIYQLIAKDTIDEYMQELLQKKQAIFDTLIDGKTTKIIDFSGAILQMLAKKNK